MIAERTYKKGYRNLIAWQEAKKLTTKIYAVTRKFPKEEQYHLVSQLRRAATSIMANLAEGSAMSTKVHRNAFYTRARGSAVEVDNFVELCWELRLMQEQEYADLIDHVARVIYLITKLIYSM